MTLVQNRSFKVVLSGSDPKEEEEGLGRRNREGEEKPTTEGFLGPETTEYLGFSPLGPPGS